MWTILKHWLIFAYRRIMSETPPAKHHKFLFGPPRSTIYRKPVIPMDCWFFFVYQCCAAFLCSCAKPKTAGFTAHDLSIPQIFVL